MKHYKTLAWMLAIAIASMMTNACSSDDNEAEKPLTTDPVEQIKFFACEANSETVTSRGITAAVDTIFTEDDIEWFNVSTREIRFKNMNEQLIKKLMKNYHREKLEFHLSENILFEVSRFVADIDSRVFFDLVLHYSTVGEEEGHPRYYLHDCYPLLPSIIADERTQANIKKNAPQWEILTRYLESKGKLKK